MRRGFRGDGPARRVERAGAPAPARAGAQASPIARAVRPHPRVLRASGVESQLPWYVVPIGHGQAISPGEIGYVVRLAREPGPIDRSAGGRLLRLGDRAW